MADAVSQLIRPMITRPSAHKLTAIMNHFAARSTRSIDQPDIVRPFHLAGPTLARLDGPGYMRAGSVCAVSLDDLPRMHFAFPGPLRDQLVAAVLSGAKTTTSGLVVGYERDNEPLPTVGQRLVVVDSADRPVGVIELTDVRVVRLADVDLQHAVDEGEGDESVAQWRAGHEQFWHSDEVRAELGADFTVDDDTLVLAQRFRLVRG